MHYETFSVYYTNPVQGECQLCDYVPVGFFLDVKGLLLIHVAEKHPEHFIDAMGKTPEEAVQQYEHELIWEPWRVTE